MTLRLFMAYVQVMVSGIFFILVISLFFSNAGNKCSNLQFFYQTFNDVSLAVLMLVCAAVGAISVFMVWILCKGGMAIHRYRKAHPIVMPGPDEMPCQRENENLSEKE